jgi:probable rRNA maturation factor
MDIAVEVDSGAWGPAGTAVEIIRSAVEAALATAPACRDGAVTVLLTGDEEAAALNLQHRGKAGATNVLSFPAPRLPGLPADEPPPLGDIVLAAGVVRREAAEQGISLDQHLRHLVVHGTLHLLGHDHDTEEKAEEMAALEAMVLKQLDIGSGGRNYGRTSGAGGAAPFDR